MAFTRTIDSIQKGGDPATIDIGLTYRDTDEPLWSFSQTLRVPFDSTQTPTQLRTAIRTFILADALRYKVQRFVYAQLLQLVGDTVEVT